MNAPALNPASTPAPGHSGFGATAASPGQAGSPLAGFEALLTALFPPGAATVAATPETGKVVDSTGIGEALPPIFVADPEIDLLAGDANTALPGGAFAGAPMIATSLPFPVEVTSADPPPAWGRGKARGVPALPALVNANPNADLSETTEPATDAAGGARTSEALSLHKAGPPPPPAPTPVAPALAQSQSSPARPAAAEAPDPDFAIQAIAVSELAKTEAAPITAAPPSATARPEPTPAPTSRNARTERTKGASDTKGTSDLRPTEAVDRPVHARTADGVAKAAATSIESDAPKTMETEVAADAPDSPQQAETRATAQALTPTALTAHAVRGSPETVANLAAQILKKLEGQSTRFDLELNPGGLGKVDVRVEIGANGQITAAMTFDNPQAAADLRARASELHRLLEQAGFDLSGGLTFDVAGDRGQQQRQAWQDQTENNDQAFRGQAFRAALDTAGDAADAAVQGALRLRRGVSAGLDLRI